MDTTGTGQPDAGDHTDPAAVLSAGCAQEDPDLATEVKPEVAALWAPVLPRWKEEHWLGGHALRSRAVRMGMEFKVSHTTISAWKSGKIVPTSFDDFRVLLTVLGLDGPLVDSERIDWEGLYKAAKEATDPHRDRRETSAEAAGPAIEAISIAAGKAAAEAKPPPDPDPGPHGPEPPGAQPRSTQPKRRFRRWAQITAVAALVVAVTWAVRISISPDHRREHASSGPHSSPGSSAAPFAASVLPPPTGSPEPFADVPAKLCSHVIGSQDVGVFPAPDTTTKRVKSKEPGSRITVLPRLAKQLHAPTGWLVVSTPADDIKHAWMKSSDVSAPGQCPDPDVIP